MIAEARKKAAERQVAIRFEKADAEQLPFAAASFDIAGQPASLMDIAKSGAPQWTSGFAFCGRAGGSSSLTAKQRLAGAARQCPQEPRIRRDRRATPVCRRLATRGDRKLFAAHRLVNIASDPFLDLVAAEEQRMKEEGLERRIRRRYAVWGDVPR
jgi:hypothetical protein